MHKKVIIIGLTLAVGIGCLAAGLIIPVAGLTIGGILLLFAGVGGVIVSIFPSSPPAPKPISK